MKARDLIRTAKRDRLVGEPAPGGDHLRLEHPEANGPVYTGSTPSDRRALYHVRATMRRLLRQKEGGR